MSSIAYVNLDMQIQRGPESGGYRLMVQSPGGKSVRATFVLPFTEEGLENFILKAGPPRRGVRRVDTQEVEAAKRFGAKLYDALFTADVRSALQSSLEMARQKAASGAGRKRTGVRIRLRLADVPELAGVPWEYMYNPTFNQFLALSTETPLVRYLDLPERTRPVRISPPLRIIVMIAGPTDLAPLNVRQEWHNLSEALGDLRDEGLVQMDVMDTPTLPALQRQLRRGEYHIFHFIGHGAFDRQTDDGVLAFEDKDGTSRMVSGQELAVLLHDHPSLRLAVLNACEGAHTTASDPFGGVAQRLVQGGLPAVAAMQFDITDEAAITFAHEFYRSIADGYPIDAAATEARKVIFTESRGNGLEWGTPTLYMRSADGQIFSVQRPGLKGQQADGTSGPLAGVGVADAARPLGSASGTTGPLTLEPEKAVEEEAVVVGIEETRPLEQVGVKGNGGRGRGVEPSGQAGAERVTGRGRRAGESAQTGRWKLMVGGPVLILLLAAGGWFFGPQLGLFTPSGPGPTQVPVVAAGPTATRTPDRCKDSFENDGLPHQAKEILLGDTQNHIFCPTNDVDTIKFFAKGGKGYSIETSNLSIGVDTYLYLLNREGKAPLLATNDDIPGGKGASRIDFFPKEDETGWYYVQVKNQGDIGKPGLTYSVSLRQVEPPAATPAATP
ncbi:MAG TPA: CHAT domain-containing protein [Chloroflexia bacterium]|nr:CHAT domain-containing protein [Chloroflexia bacterium]